MAAPHVAGVVTLRKQVNLSETPDSIKSILQSNADPLPYDQTVVGAGRVNAQKVVQAP
jgi:subtilisin family serine protease